MRIPLTLTLMTFSSQALATEYRQITLADGRTLPAEIRSITATEMVLKTPQGIVKVSPNDLRDMAPMSAEDYAAVPPWQVLVLPFSGEAESSDDSEFAHLFSLRVLESIPAVSPVTVSALPDSVRQTTKSALKVCGTDLQCATRHGQDAGANVVVMGRVDPSSDEDILTLGAVFVDAPAARKRVEVRYQDKLLNYRKEMTDSLYSTLFLTPPPDAKIPAAPLPVADTQPAPARRGEPDLDRLAWTPLPGITAYKQNDMAGFATAMGVVAVGTTASVYMAGHATYSAPQMVAMTALSSYGLTVFVNHLFLKK
jgi:hypothetical protein